MFSKRIERLETLLGLKQNSFVEQSAKIQQLKTSIEKELELKTQENVNFALNILVSLIPVYPNILVTQQNQSFLFTHYVLNVTSHWFELQDKHEWKHLNSQELCQFFEKQEQDIDSTLPLLNAKRAFLHQVFGHNAFFCTVTFKNKTYNVLAELNNVLFRVSPAATTIFRNELQSKLENIFKEQPTTT